MARALNKDFFEWLQKDSLKLLEIISKYDCLAIHFSESDSLKIYFKGFLILTISDKIVKNKEMRFKVLSPAYLKKENSSHLTNIIKRGVSIANLQEYFDIVIGFLSRRNNLRIEETIRQEISYVNNRSRVANDTDYFIVAEEYKIDGPKFDLVAVKWASKNQVRKKFNANTPSLEIVVFELKHGLHAIGGSKESKSEKADLKKHNSDFQAFVSDNDRLAEFKLDIVKMFVQQASLKGFYNNNIEGLKHVRALSEKELKTIADNIPVRFGMIISDYKRKSQLLKEQISQIPDDFLFATSSFMGYGLYEESMLNREQLILELR